MSVAAALASRRRNGYKKGVGPVLEHQPDGHGALRAPNVTRVTPFHVSALARWPPDGGLCFTYIRDEARSIRQRSVSSVKTIRRLMAANSFTHCGSMRRVSAWSDRVTKPSYPAG